MPHARPRAFALPELLISAFVGAVLVSLLAVSTSRSRGHAQQQGSIANLHEFAAITSSYAADNADQFWGNNWNNGDAGPTQYADLREPFASFADAAGCQAVDILRRRGGLPNLPRYNNNWNPFVFYPHLPLCDYLDRGVILPFAVSPGDRNFVLWSRDPAGFRAGTYLPNSPDPVTFPQSPSRTSYVRGGAFSGPDYYMDGRGAVWGGCGAGGETLGTPNTPQFTMGHRRVAEVTDPSRKVFMFDRAQWSAVRVPISFLNEDARVPTLLVDGSTRIPPTFSINPGFNPAAPFSAL